MPPPGTTTTDAWVNRGGLAGSQRKPALDVFGGSLGVGMILAVLAACLAGTCAGAQRVVDDGLDRTGTPAALRAAPETAVELLGVAWQFLRRFHRLADVVVAEDVAGADNHEPSSLPRCSIIDSDPRRAAQRQNRSFEAIPNFLFNLERIQVRPVAADQTRSVKTWPGSPRKGRPSITATAAISPAAIATAIRAPAIERITHAVGRGMTRPTCRVEAVVMIGGTASVWAGSIASRSSSESLPIRRGRQEQVEEHRGHSDCDNQAYGAGHASFRVICDTKIEPFLLSSRPMEAARSLNIQAECEIFRAERSFRREDPVRKVRS